MNKFSKKNQPIDEAICEPASELIADPTIEQTCRDYLQSRLGLPPQQTKNTRPDQRESALDLLQGWLYHHGRQYLSLRDQHIHESLANPNSPSHRGFHQIFGPSKLMELFPALLHFLIFDLDQAINQSFISSVCLTLEDYCVWLMRHDHVQPDDGEEAAFRCAELARNLPRARRAWRRLLKDVCQSGPGDGKPVAEEPQNYCIARLQRELIWLENEIGERFGPVLIGEKNRRDLELGWEMRCILQRAQTGWRLVACSGIYPHPR